MKGIRYVEESRDWAKRLDDASVREKNKKTRKRRILLYKKIQLTIAGYPTYSKRFFDFLRLIFETSTILIESTKILNFRGKRLFTFTKNHITQDRITKTNCTFTACI
jgi:hypothetical protein